MLSKSFWGRAPSRAVAATRGGVRLRSVSIAFGFMEAADAIDWQKLDWPRDPYEPDEFLAPEGAVCWDNGAIVPKVDLVFEVPIPEAEEQGYASATLVVPLQNWLIIAFRHRCSWAAAVFCASFC